MTHIFAALAGVGITIAVIYALLLFNEWRWNRHDAFWDGEGVR